MFSTESHSKIMVSDDGRGAWFAAVGSCNWLGSPFQRYEVSVKIRDLAFCGRIVRHLATMSIGREAIWNDLAVDITKLGRRIEASPQTSERKVPMRILLASDHAALAIEASVKAKRRRFVASHRFPNPLSVDRRSHPLNSPKRSRQRSGQWELPGRPLKGSSSSFAVNVPSVRCTKRNLMARHAA